MLNPDKFSGGGNDWNVDDNGPAWRPNKMKSINHSDYVNQEFGELPTSPQNDPRAVTKGDVLVMMKGRQIGQVGGHVGMATGRTKADRNGNLLIEMTAGNAGGGAVATRFYPANQLTIRRALAPGQEGAPTAIGAPSIVPSLGGKQVQGDLATRVAGLEGVTSKATCDYKQWSVGYGTRAKYPGDVIGKEEGQRRLSQELAKAQVHVDRFVPEGTPQHIKEALASLTYNSGTRWQSGNLGKAIKAGNWDEARTYFSQYNEAGGQVNRGLVNRRSAELGWGWDTPGMQAQQQAASQWTKQGTPTNSNHAVPGRLCRSLYGSRSGLSGGAVGSRQFVAAIHLTTPVRNRTAPDRTAPPAAPEGGSASRPDGKKLGG
jgi:GH24 family phage-related lysozyme (muramidase)